MHFAKLFTIGENQILFTRDYQTERIGEKTYGIAYRVDIDREDKVEGRFGYDSQETMDKYWVQIDLSMAGKILSQSLKFYTND